MTLLQTGALANLGCLTCEKWRCLHESCGPVTQLNNGSAAYLPRRGTETS